MKRLAIGLLSAAILVSCGGIQTVDSEVESQITREGIQVPLKSLAEFQGIGTLSSLTPTGEKIFSAMLTWQDAQWQYRNSTEAKRLFATPEPRMCAGNLSQVLAMTGIPSLRRYRWTAVDEVLTAVNQVGSVYRFPKTKQGIIETLERVYNGKVPVGSIVGGCLKVDSRGVCERIDGSRHIGLIGDTRTEIIGGKKHETIMIYHNNWYRPENASGQWHPHMVSKRNLNAGFPRQWMPTPWLTVIRDLSSNKIVDVKTPLINPVTKTVAIDDMDPFTYHTFVAILPEIAQELASGNVSDESLPPAPGLFCEISPNANGPFSNVRSSHEIGENVLTTLPRGHSVKIRGFLDDRSGGSTRWASIEFVKNGEQFGAPARPSFVAISQVGKCKK